MLKGSPDKKGKGANENGRKREKKETSEKKKKESVFFCGCRVICGLLSFLLLYSITSVRHLIQTGIPLGLRVHLFSPFDTAVYRNRPPTMNGFELSSYKTSTMRSDVSTIYHPSPAPSLAGTLSSGNTIGYHQSPPVPIDKTTCIALVTDALREAREKNREAELRGRGNNSPDLGAQQQFYQRSGVTIDLSHQKISNIPLEVIELIKDEIERSENRKL